MRARLGSLRGLLLRWLILPLLALALGAGVVAYLLLRQPVESAYDQALGDSALALIPHLRNRDGHVSLALSAEIDKVLRTDRHDQIFYQVRDAAGVAVAGDRELPPPPKGLLSEHEPYSYRTHLRDRSLRLIALRHNLDGAPVTLIVAETTRKRDHMAWQLALGLLLPQLLVAAGAVAISVLAVRRGLRPLNVLREDIARRAPQDLRPLPDGHAVEEVMPLLDEINALLKRLAEANAAQRRFVANAAHQLRTPLTGLRTQLELALTETDGGERDRRIEVCRQAVERMTRLINQILVLAAAEEGGREAEAMHEEDLAELLGEMADGWVRRAIAADIDLGFQLESVKVLCDRLLIQELAGNLVDNALRYSGKGSAVTVRCGVEAGGPVLAVEDNGVGVAEAARERIGQRYFRPDGSPGGGSGLGLAIVREIAARHGAEVAVTAGTDPSREPSGLRVTLRFPAAATAT